MWLPAIGWQGVRDIVEYKIDAAFWFLQSRPRAGTPSLIYRFKTLGPLGDGVAFCEHCGENQQRDEGVSQVSRSGDHRSSIIDQRSALSSCWPPPRSCMVWYVMILPCFGRTPIHAGSHHGAACTTPILHSGPSCHVCRFSPLPVSTDGGTGPDMWSG